MSIRSTSIFKDPTVAKHLSPLHDTYVIFGICIQYFVQRTYISDVPKIKTYPMITTVGVFSYHFEARFVSRGEPISYIPATDVFSEYYILTLFEVIYLYLHKRYHQFFIMKCALVHNSVAHLKPNNVFSVKFRYVS